jgi:hypothetical protein
MGTPEGDRREKGTLLFEAMMRISQNECQTPNHIARKFG